MTKTVKSPHRHHPGEHTESELRYLTPARFTVPSQLGGMSHVSSRANPHADRYYEAPDAGEPLLRRAGASLRVRVKADGQVLATFKVKLPDEGARSRRQETEDAVRCDDCLTAAAECECGVCSAQDNYADMVNEADSTALDKARALAGNVPFIFLFSIANDRLDHHYRCGSGHVVLSEDTVTYPDGSVESRVEVEHVAGDPAQLDRIHAELKMLHPELRKVKRGKLSEGRRRLAAVLAA